MKDLIADANFPRTSDQRVYHLGLRAGEVANRIVTVGSLSRAESIASFLDASPKLFRLTSERGFLTITGRYKGVPISICSIGMGYPNMDFFVREVRECLGGDMLVVRLGSCGCLLDHPVGTIVVPKACVAVSRNYDYDFGIGDSPEPPYRVSKPVEADTELAAAVRDGFNGQDAQVNVLADVTNAFYSSQGRQTSFPDHNQNLVPTLLATIPGLATLEMETHHLYHLAASYRPGQIAQSPSSVPPITTSPPQLHLGSTLHNSSVQPLSASPKNGTHEPPHLPSLSPPSFPRIRAAAAQIVFASRTSTQAQDFITPEMVTKLEKWTGETILSVLAGFHVDDDKLHPAEGSVWDLSPSPR
ncbi:purine and uridine phosphorylase [Neolentinus lepideus HHB14362 ss-1]|uniref:Purine and uridine phosphorylase n=1 Tax=Neolentinus lepideus HHB14362 ss-1 TaxID=1314782 RepID=A0A165RW79_9AGAM|nr:purine and uridine phosphorylase [Neolentinus lepideus HHB14362 ss-1]